VRIQDQRVRDIGFKFNDTEETLNKIQGQIAGFNLTLKSYNKQQKFCNELADKTQKLAQEIEVRKLSTSEFETRCNEL
jgi:hypothetical protein